MVLPVITMSSGGGSEQAVSIAANNTASSMYLGR